MRTNFAASILAVPLVLIGIAASGMAQQEDINPPTSMPSITLPDTGEWYILLGGYVTEKMNEDIVQISLPFNTSNRVYGTDIFTKDCITPFDSNSYFRVSTSERTSDSPDGFIQFNTTLDMNITALNDTEYWTYFIDGSHGGYVEVCVETYLKLNNDILGNPGPTIMFKNYVLNISVSMNIRFSTGDNEDLDFDVKFEKAEPESIIDVRPDYSEMITTFTCDASDSSNIPIKLTSDSPYKQGDELTICVGDTGDGIVQVAEYEDLFVSQAGSEDYYYMKDSLYNPDFISITCQDGTSTTTGRVCYAKIILLARFFSKLEPPDIFVRGSMGLTINSARRERRNLLLNLPLSQKNEGVAVASSRFVEEKGKGSFKMQVSLVSTRDSVTSSPTSSATSSKYGRAGGLVSIQAIFLLFLLSL